MNGTKPVDLLDLARAAGLEEAKQRAELSRADAVQLVTFASNRERDRVLPIGRHPQNNRVVFPDMKRLGSGIKPGESYFCDLSEYHPKAGPSVYYANPIAKVDAAFLFDLHPDQVDKLLDALIRTSQAQLTEGARTKIRAELERSMAGQLDTLTLERDSLRSENSTLNSELAGIRELALTRTLTESREVSQTSPSTVRAESKPQTLANLESAPTASRVQTLPLTGRVSYTLVKRLRADYLESPALADGRFFVHVAPNRKRLFIHPHPDGNLHASESVLEVPGLSILRPFDGEEELLASADLRVGGLTVELEAIPGRVGL